jgi:hypothetical protein
MSLARIVTRAPLQRLAACRVFLSSPYSSGRSRHWIKSKNPNAPAVKREADARIAAHRRSLARTLFCCGISARRLVVWCAHSVSTREQIYMNGLQEQLEGQQAASEEVREQFKALVVEECGAALSSRAEEND